MLNLSPLDTFAKSSPDLPALIYQNGILTYTELNTQVEKAVTFLKEHNIAEQDKVAFISRNRFDEIIFLLALYYNKNIAVPLSFRYTAEQLDDIIEKIQPEVLISFEKDPLAGIEFNQTDLDQCEPSPLQDWDLNSDAGIVLSSGSTGQPKGVLHTLGNYYYSAIGANELLQLNRDDRYLLSLPLFHVGGIGIVFRTILAGATLVIPDKNLALVENAALNNITHLSLVATQLKELVETIDDTTTRQLKAVLLGGSAIPDYLIGQTLNKNIPVIKSYGSTESASLVTATGLDDPPEKLKTSGKVLNHRKIKISDEGEILIGGGVLFKKYLGDEKIYSNKDWFATGDLGFIDEDGYLIVSGRRDNMFISGGENIYPEEIEAALLNDPLITEAVIVPVTDKKFGQLPVAFISADKEFDPAQIDWPLEKFKRPHKFYPWPTDYQKTGLKINRSYFVELAKKLNS